MKKLAYCSVLVAVACLATVRPALGQEKDGGGGFLDWIHKLSGPSMLGPAASYYWGFEGFRVRVAADLRFPVGFKDHTIEPDHSLNMLSLQPSMEIPVNFLRIRDATPFELNAGIGLHRLGGKGHDAVYHISIPIYGQVRIPLGSQKAWFLRIGLGAHYFPSFSEEDFDGGIHVLTHGGEFTPGMILGIDYDRR